MLVMLWAGINIEAFYCLRTQVLVNVLKGTLQMGGRNLMDIAKTQLGPALARTRPQCRVQGLGFGGTVR